MKNNTLIVIGNLSYPSASAPSNRVHLYCKAFIDAKGFPLVINTHSELLTKLDNEYFIRRFDGVPFYYCQKTAIRKNNFFLRNFNKLIGFINLLIVVRKLSRNRKIAVLFFSNSFTNELIYSLFLRYYKIAIIKECNEAPDFIRYEKKFVKIRMKFLKHFKLKIYDRLIVISDYLNDFYSQLYPVEKIEQFPILVDIERFQTFDEPKFNQCKILTYTGKMSGDKDGLDILIDAFSIVIENFPNVKLNLIGNASPSDIKRLEDKIKKLDLIKTIQFYGQKSLTEIPKLLAASDVLVLGRPNNNQAKAGFPTKLGEYLASKKPVVITKTGEISKYLIDNESAYLAEPGDAQSLSERIIFALKDPNATKVGENGFKVANTQFNYKLFSNKIFSIVETINP